MTATAHVAPRTTVHHPLAALRAHWNAFHLRHSRRAQTATFQRLHDALPLDDPDRYALDAPALEDAFQRLAVDHGDRVTQADGGQAARDLDREQQLLAVCDAWFRDVHGPEHGWSPRLIIRHHRLMTSVHAAFHSGSAS